MKKIKLLLGIMLIITVGCKQEATDIKIGAIFSLSGAAGDYGKKSIQGIQMAVELLNQAGGINGEKIQVVYEDAKSSPKDALSAFQKLYDINHVNLFVGDVYSSTTKSLIEHLPSNVILFAPGASEPDLVGMKTNFLRNWTSDNFDGLAMADIVTADSITNISTLTQISDYTLALNNAFKQEFQTKGGKIGLHESFEGNKSDYRQVLLKFKAAGIQAIYLTALSKEMGTILKQAIEINYTPKWFTNLTVNTDDCRKIAGDAIRGVVFSRPYIDFKNLTKESQTFLKLYKEKYGSDPDETVAHSFDAINILALAVKEVGSSPPKLVGYINKIKNYPGLSGKTTFDGKGGVLKDIEVLRFENHSAKSLKIFSF